MSLTGPSPHAARTAESGKSLRPQATSRRCRRRPPALVLEMTSLAVGVPDAGLITMTTALRHARNASRVEIQVVEGAGRLRLRVTDDGRTDPTWPTSHGFGLLGMVERTQLLGGTLIAGPAPEGGWTVDAELPSAVRR